MVSRRNFLNSAVAAIVAPFSPRLTEFQTKAQAAPIDATRITTAKLQVNLNFPHGNIDFPFLNAVNLSDRVWTLSGNSDVDHYALIGPDGYLTSYPGGASDVRTYIGAYLTNPDLKDPWVLTWDGNGKIQIQITDRNISYPVTGAGSNRVEYTIKSSIYPAGHPVAVIILIQAIGTPHISNIRFFRKSQEGDLDNGKMWNPDFLNFYKVWGRIRFMNWMAGVTCPVIGWDTMPPEDQGIGTSPSKTGKYFLGSLYCGQCNKSRGTRNAYTAPKTLSNDPTSWTGGMSVWISCPYSSNPTFTKILGISNSNPATVTTTKDHGLADGDTIFFRSLSNGTVATQIGSGGFFKISSVMANSFTIPVNSAGWGKYAGSAVIANQVTVATSSLPAKPVVMRDSHNLYPTFPGRNQDLWQLTYDALYDALIFESVGTGAAAQSTMPVSLLCDLANELGVDPWFTVPCMASDGCIANIAKIIKEKLDTNRTAIIELGNEIWNWAQNWFLFANNRAKLLAAAQPSHWKLKYPQTQWEAWRYYSMMTIFNSVFADQASRLHGMICTQLASWVATPYLLDGTGTPVLVKPYTLAKSFAFAPYIRPKYELVANAEYVYGYKLGGSLRTAALAWLDNLFRTGGAEGSWFLSLTALSKMYATFRSGDGKNGGYGMAPYSLQMTNYEGGFSCVAKRCKLTDSSFKGVALLQTEIPVVGADDNGSGAIRLTVGSTTTLVNHSSYWISDIQGTAEANGYWAVAIVDKTHFDLIGSAFKHKFIPTQGSSRAKVDSDVDNFVYGYKDSDLFAQLALDNCNQFVAAGGEFPSQYCVTGIEADDQPWQVVSPSIYGTKSPAYYILRKFNGR